MFFTAFQQHALRKTQFFTILLQHLSHKHPCFTMISQHAVAAVAATATETIGRPLPIPPPRAAQRWQGKLDLQNTQYMSIFFWPSATEQGPIGLNKPSHFDMKLICNWQWELTHLLASLQWLQFRQPGAFDRRAILLTRSLLTRYSTTGDSRQFTI